MTAGYESLMFLLAWYSYHNLLWRMDKICPSDKPYCTVVSGVGDLYRNPVLCERLVGRTRILLKFNFLTAITYIYFHTNLYYHISMKGDNI